MDPHQDIDPERAPLLTSKPIQKSDNDYPQPETPTHIARNLYISHILSTWNSRVFEFAAILYLVAVFPGTFVPMSVYALTRCLAAIVFAPCIGGWIDGRGRLGVVRGSIVFQRLSVALSCAIFYVLAQRLAPGPYTAICLLISLAILACVEKVSSITNTVSVEKDWVVVISGKDPKALRTMNARMRRIDMICKLSGPLFIALIDGVSSSASMGVIFGMNIFSAGVECYTIAMVYKGVPGLQEPKRKVDRMTEEKESENGASNDASTQRGMVAILDPVAAFLKRFVRDFAFYVHHRMFLPSLAGALLWLTVLSFGGPMIAYLRLSGYDSTQIGILRTVGTVLEISATWIAPWLVGRIGAVKAGLCMSLWQVTLLITGTTVFFLAASMPSIAVAGLVIGMVISRVGLRGFDLCLQVIVQQEVEPENRGKFSSVEAAYQNFFGLCSVASTLVFSRPEQFRWPVLITNAAIATASLAYATFVFSRRREGVNNREI